MYTIILFYYNNNQVEFETETSQDMMGVIITGLKLTGDDTVDYNNTLPEYYPTTAIVVCLWENRGNKSGYKEHSTIIMY